MNMRGRSSVVTLLVLAALSDSARVRAGRLQLETDDADGKLEVETNDGDADIEAPCFGCNKYPEAADYPDNWLTEVGAQKTMEMLNEMKEAKADEELTDEEKLTAFRLNWDMAAHAVFNMVQGQGCMDLCAICLPSQMDMASKHPKLQTIHVSRAKNWQNATLWPLTGTVDVGVGAVVGAVSGIPAALASFFVGGGFTGIAAGSGLATVVANKTGSSFAGNLLGAVAGITTGVLTGVTYFAAIEILGLALGVWKGVGLTAAMTNCKRVGFERFQDGEHKDMGSDRKEKPFTSVPFNSTYGLKRLRQWMKDNEDWRQNTARYEIGEGDEKSLEHCERVREHNFDMRHATECLKHTQLCGPQGSLIMPVTSPGSCQKVSSIEWLEEKAVQFGDDPEKGIFAQWRKMQKEIQEKTGFDGKQVQCVVTLCKYGGYKKASMKLHPDRLVRANISDEERLLLQNTFTFLGNCKTEYKGMDGGELKLDSAEERDVVCEALKKEGSL